MLRCVSNRSARRFPIRFDAWYRLLSTVLLMPVEACFVKTEGDDVEVRMAWAFRARFPRSAVASTARLDEAPLSRGVHGWAGRWLVNGSGDRILVIDLAPVQRARVLGFPVRLRQLMVSVDEPGSLADALRASPASP
jgi:hypothetical protein